MDEKSLLLAKVDALFEQLNWAESSLKNAKIEPRISEAASIGFAVLFDNRRKELTQLRNSIQKIRSYGSAWAKLQSSSTSCKELFEECLGFLGGAMLRDAHKQNDICEIADALLEELGRKSVQWNRVTLLAQAHFFTETTGLIRLPFPDYGIWNLPIAAHELGHFVGPQISGQGKRPFQECLDAIEKRYNLEELSEEERAEKQPQMEREISHLREIFSDLFAVYSLGPAFACSCIVLLFDPQDATACVDSKTHPSHRKRVHFILAALRQMSKTDGDPYRKIIKMLEDLWERNLKSAENEKCIAQEDLAPLNYKLLELYPILTTFVPTVQYSGWNRAIELSKEFPLNGKSAEILKEEDSIADVLNAVWIWRLLQAMENSNVVYRINLEGSALCRQIMQRHPRR
jgi:hypothetical protein